MFLRRWESEKVEEVEVEVGSLESWRCILVVVG